jgi:hypothetical protein
LHRFFATTNHKQFSHTDIDDRRHAFYEVSESKKKDQPYFDQLFAAILDDQVIAAMIHDLKERDISRFNVRALPKTSDHSDQILKSLSGLDRYWYHLLSLGKINTPLDGDNEWSGAGVFINTEGVLQGYRNYDVFEYRYERPTTQDIRMFFKTRCPSAKPDRQRVWGREYRGYLLPSLSTARNEFAAALDITISWC